MEKIVKVQRVNVTIPGLGICQVGFAFKLPNGKFRVKTIHGIFEMNESELTIFNTVEVERKNWM